MDNETVSSSASDTQEAVGEVIAEKSGAANPITAGVATVDEVLEVAGVGAEFAEAASTSVAATLISSPSGWFESGATRIYYEVEGSGDSVLLLPGLTSAIDDLADLRAFLVSKGFRVIAADLPGSGKSLPQPRIYTADYYAEDAACLGRMIEELSIAPAHIVGMSDGGETALLLAATQPALVRSIFSIGAVGVLSDPKGEIVDLFQNVVDNPPEDAMGYKEYLVSRYGEENARIATQSVAAAFKEIVARGGSISRDLADKITAPVLFIAGENDPFAPRAEALAMKARILDAHLITVPGGEHAVHHSHAGLVKSALHAFYYSIHAYEKEPEEMSATEKIGNTVGNLASSS